MKLKPEFVFLVNYFVIWTLYIIIVEATAIPAVRKSHDNTHHEYTPVTLTRCPVTYKWCHMGRCHRTSHAWRYVTGVYSWCVLSWDFCHTWWRHSSVETSCWQNTIVHQQKGVAFLKICFQWWTQQFTNSSAVLSITTSSIIKYLSCLFCILCKMWS
jgi:hypothetical protein